MPALQQPHLVGFGLGYVGLQAALTARDLGWRVSGTCRSASRASEIAAATGLTSVHAFDLDEEYAGLTEAGLAQLADATHLLATVPPVADFDRDPLLALHAEEVERACGGADGRLRWVGYLSTTSVYGDHDGGWVGELAETRCAPGSASAHRLAGGRRRGALAANLLGAFSHRRAPSRRRAGVAARRPASCRAASRVLLPPGRHLRPRTLRTRYGGASGGGAGRQRRGRGRGGGGGGGWTAAAAACAVRLPHPCRGHLRRAARVDGAAGRRSRQLRRAAFFPCLLFPSHRRRVAGAPGLSDAPRSTPAGIFNLADDAPAPRGEAHAHTQQTHTSHSWATHPRALGLALWVPLGSCLWTWSCDGCLALPHHLA